MDVNASLREGGRGSSGGARKRRLSGLLVIAEMALAVVLLAGRGLDDPQLPKDLFDQHGSESQERAGDAADASRREISQSRTTRSLSTIVSRRSWTRCLASWALPSAITMPTGGSMNFPYELEHAQPVDEKMRPSISLLVISPDYFRVMELPILQGRAFCEYRQRQRAAGGHRESALCRKILARRRSGGQASPHLQRRQAGAMAHGGRRGSRTFCKTELR